MLKHDDVGRIVFPDETIFNPGTGVRSSCCKKVDRDVFCKTRAQGLMLFLMIRSDGTCCAHWYPAKGIVDGPMYGKVCSSMWKQLCGMDEGKHALGLQEENAPVQTAVLRESNWETSQR
jgi:hypothetical protein